MFYCCKKKIVKEILEKILNINLSVRVRKLKKEKDFLEKKDNLKRNIKHRSPIMMNDGWHQQQFDRNVICVSFPF